MFVPLLIALWSALSLQALAAVPGILPRQASSDTTPQTNLPSTTSMSFTANGTISGVSTVTATNGNVSLSLTATSPVITPNPTAPPVVAGEYKLRTRVVNNGPHRFNNMYLGAWSTIGNVSADAIFTNRTLAAHFYANSTFEQADLGTRGRLWSMQINYDIISAEWYFVTIRTPVSNGFGTFYFNGTGLQWTPNTTPPPHPPGLAQEIDAYFGGWFICDWWHGVPQLFFKNGLFADIITPNGCADVQ